MSEAEHQPRRPWTVIALVVLGIIGTSWNLAFEEWGARNLFSLGLAVLFAWGLWTAKRWAYWLTFAGALLAGLILAIFVFSGSTQVDTTYKVVWFVNVVVTLFLLWYPATRRFIGLDKESRSLGPPGPPDRGGRVAQGFAISIFGLLAIAVPLLWAFGKLDGVLLVLGLGGCVCAGVAVLLLGLPAKKKVPASRSSSS